VVTRILLKLGGPLLIIFRTVIQTWDRAALMTIYH